MTNYIFHPIVILNLHILLESVLKQKQACKLFGLQTQKGLERLSIISKIFQYLFCQDCILLHTFFQWNFLPISEIGRSPPRPISVKWVILRPLKISSFNLILIGDESASSCASNKCSNRSNMVIIFSSSG